MRDDDHAAQPELFGARALREWITGEHTEHSRIFLLEDGADVSDLDDVAGHDDVVLLPAESAPYDGPAGTARYSGALREVGDELFFGERGVELQDYVAAAFVQIIGPTAVRFFDETSWLAFLDDAELARRTGVFPSALTDPRVLLADRAALVRPDGLEAPSALRLSPDGAVSLGLQGEILGSTADLEALLTVPLPGAAALGGVVPRDVLAADLASREWIARYLGATDLIKMLRLETATAKISGFGWSLIDDGRADAEPLATDPFLLDTDDGFLLADIGSLRRQLLSESTAVVVAAAQTSRSTEVAADRVARRLGIATPDARALCREARTALSVHVGTPADARFRTAGVEG